MTETIQPDSLSKKTDLRSTVERSRREIKLTLKELCNAASVSERTVRYYIQQGLLPPPQGAGPASRYNLEHLRRLALVRRLKATLLPLSEIKHLMSGVSTSELEQVAHEFYHELTITNPVALDPTRPVINRVVTAESIQENTKVPPELKVFVPPEINEEQAEEAISVPPHPATETRPNELTPTGKWNRVVLVSGLEIHFEEGGSQDNELGQEKLARLLDFARQLYAD
jgi:DNA-binding transcriptional MerR regulator